MPDERLDRPRKSIVLVGFMGAGKSTIGRALARRLNLPFIDTDTAIEESFGLSIAEIFREFGEAGFRAAERKAISRLVLSQAAVIAVGGGAFVDPVNREALNGIARTIWLDTPFELIMSRLTRSSGRPLARDRSESELRALWEERRESYVQASVRIDASESHPDNVVDRILAAIRSVPV